MHVQGREVGPAAALHSAGPTRLQKSHYHEEAAIPADASPQLEPTITELHARIDDSHEHAAAVERAADAPVTPPDQRGARYWVERVADQRQADRDLRELGINNPSERERIVAEAELLRRRHDDRTLGRPAVPLHPVRVPPAGRPHARGALCQARPPRRRTRKTAPAPERGDPGPPARRGRSWTAVRPARTRRPR